jgi:putative phage-type endonuclease
MSLTLEQQAARKIGGSDIAAILNIDPWKTPEELRLEKLGRLTPEPAGERAELGEIMEEPIRQIYSKRTGRIVHRVHQTLVHPKYDWLTAHIDGRVVGEKIGVECKHIHWRLAHLWGQEGSDEIAEHYLPQVLEYLMVTGYEAWDVAAFTGDLKIYTVEPDQEWFEMIAEATHDFWHVNVLGDVPCELDMNRTDALRVLKRLYPGTTGEVIEASEQLNHWHRVYREASDLRKQYETTADAAKAHLLRAMGEASQLKLSDGVYTRKTIERKAYSVAATSYTDFRFKDAPRLGD